MRRALLGIAAALGAASGAHGQGPVRGPAGHRTAPAVAVAEQSNICVSVEVDQRLWSAPDDALFYRNFSGHLMSELRRLYERRGGSVHLPGTQNQARFVTNANWTNPLCQDRSTDVLIDVRYGPRGDGTPFTMQYRVARGEIVRSGRIELDLAEEIRAGRIRGYSQRRTNIVILAEDVRQQAPSLVNLIIH
jgi:hypothetical protein